MASSVAKVEIVHRFGVIRTQCSLENWFNEYDNSEPLDLGDERDPPWLKVVEDDTLNMEAIEAEIERQKLSVQLSTDGHCPKCQDFISILAPYVGGDAEKLPDVGQVTKSHYNDYCEWEASRRAGCKLCDIIMQPGVKRPYGADLIKYQKFQHRLFYLGKKLSHELTFRAQTSQVIRFLFKAGNHVYSKILLDEFLVAEIQDGSQSFFSETRVPLSLPVPPQDEAEPFELAKQWLSACLATHSSCDRRSSHQLPTRFLALDGANLKLIKSKNLEGCPRYATLSHCWGMYKFLRLTKNTQKEFEMKIPVENLPKTFQDAISVTQQLGIHYLWIDSLCIIQDSPEDWEKEASLMCDVYGNSTINLAAASSSDGRGGCQLAQPGLCQKVNVHGSITSSGVAHKFIIRKMAQFETFVDRSHLSSRAWALQERILAPRTIFFSPLGIFWECDSKFASEAWPEGLDSYEGRKKAWYDIVMKYSAANLTFPSDKLVALAGLARQAQNQNQDQYLAGMWRENLVDQLCWSRNTVSINKPHIHPRYSPYIAPTWSWASLDCEMTITSKDAPVLPLARILDAHTTPSGKDLFGQISAGTIKLACSALVPLDPFKVERKARNKDGISYIFLARRMTGIIFDTDDEVTRPAYLLPLVDHIHEQINGIAIEEVEGLKSVFHRIGYFFYRVPTEAGYRLSAELENEGRGRATAASLCAEELYDREYPEQRFVITLV